MAMTNEQRKVATQQIAEYEKAMAAEDARNAGSLRVLSGEQYAAEDALSALRDKLGPDSDLEALRKSAGELGGRFSWFDDVTTFMGEIDSEDERRRLEDERNRRLPDDNSGGGRD